MKRYLRSHLIYSGINDYKFYYINKYIPQSKMLSTSLVRTLKLSQLRTADSNKTRTQKGSLAVILLIS